MHKKGVSEVVTVILIILISIAAVVILWNIIRPMIQDTGDKVASGCLGIDVAIESCNAYSAAVADDPATTEENETAEEVLSTIKLMRNTGGGDVAALNVIIETEGEDDTTVIECKLAKTLGELESTSVTLTNCTDPAGTEPLLTSADSVKVAAVLTSGAKCDPSTAAQSCS